MLNIIDIQKLLELTNNFVLFPKNKLELKINDPYYLYYL